MATQAPASIFDPQLYEDVRAPAMRAGGLPFYTYTSDDWYDREMERIFSRDWIYVCRADEIPETGDYVFFEFLNEPIVVVRGKDMQIRAFSASCRHRGTPIVHESGNCRVFRCPYHSWTYALDGELLGGPPEMQETENFDKSAYGLIGIPCDAWDGFVFINLDREAKSLTEFLGDLPEKLHNYDLDEMRCTERWSYDLECNWKIYVENAMEEYHVATVHQKTIQETLPMSVWSVEDDPQGSYMSMYGKMPGSLALLKGDVGLPAINTLGEKEANGSYIILTLPNTTFGFTIDTCWWLQVIPVSPERSEIRVGAAFPRTSVERPDFEEIAQNYYKRWRTTLDEDNEISELQQRGVRTRLNYRVGRISYRETLVHEIANYVLDRVLDDE